ncbi:Type I restriction-modification system, specificity subunit S [Methanosarcina sp. MTP4]|uniref:restriction endonuclease subunit S n=1 Tax=Methanosarcina sp. MTP4 TaxID=1434100 RepID=UPI000615D92E|nr:restriction endonuclease subunit S [Methanosarcina sp. MTP4]AKB24659.1 Type I restriction-modification system, specificity subunit S [Methanosarcina sp. MTP4]
MNSKTKFKETEIGSIPEDWQVKELGEIAEFRQGLQIAKSQRRGEPVENSYPLLKITDMGTNNFSEYIVDPQKKYVTSKDDIIFTRTGQVGLVYTNLIGVLHNNCFKIITDPREIDRNFLFYYLKSKYVQNFIKGCLASSVQSDLTHRQFKRCHIIIPPLEEQQNIGNSLFLLDQKIELNRQMNSTLEQIAQALFKRWFIDFEFPDENGNPYRSSGGRMVDSELGEIPEGWKPSSVGAEYDIIMGQSPPGNTYNENGEGEPFFQGRRDFGWRYPENRVYCTQPNRMAKKGDTLLSVRAPVGDINKATSDCCIGRGLAALRHKSGCEAYTYYSLMDLSRNFKSFDSEGTVFGSINQKDLKALKVLKPSSSIVEVFTHAAGVIDQQIFNFEIQIRILSQLRDSLLPKLMSGKIRVGC